MKLIKIVLNQLFENKTRALITLLSVLIFCALFLFALVDIKVNYEEKLKAIKDMPNNQVILNRRDFFEKETALTDKTVVYSTTTELSTGQSIDISVVSDNFLMAGIPVYTSVHDGYIVIDEITILHGSFDFEEITNPIVIDLDTSLKRFKRENSIGSKMLITINDVPVEFEVAAVINNTRENFILKSYLIDTNQYEENRVFTSRAYIRESDYMTYSAQIPRYEYAQVVYTEMVDSDDVKLLYQSLGIDYSTYASRINSYNEYKDEITQTYRNSILSNVLIIGIVLIAFLVFYVINVFSSLQKTKTDISYMKTIGVNEKTQLKIILLNWIVLISSGFLITFIGVFIMFRVIEGSKIWSYLGFYSQLGLMLLALLLVLTVLIVLPLSTRFISKMNYAKHKMGIED